MRRATLQLTALLAGCPGGPVPAGDEGSPETTDSADAPDRGDSAAEEGWSIVADRLGDAVLLSAWRDGDELLIVGGDLSDGGHGDLLRYDGSALCVEERLTKDAALWWIHGAEGGPWRAVGAGGAVVIGDGDARWRDDVATDATLFGVWDAGEEIWAVGGDVDTGRGEIWRRTEAWALVAGDLPGLIFKVWGDASGVLWFVGVEQAWRWDGAALIEDSADLRLVTVRGRSADDVWAVGGLSGAEVARWDGGAWVQQGTEGLTAPLNGLWTDEGEPLWVAGNSGAMGYSDGEGWQIPDAPLTNEHFHAVWRLDDEALFFGGNVFSAGENYGTIGRHGSLAGDRTLTLEVCDR